MVSGKPSAVSGKPHHQLDAWREAMTLVKRVYEVTAAFPKDEIYGLTSQVRRAAVSIPSNIAEGSARNGKKEFLQFVGIARGSLAELETQLLIAIELGYLQDEHDISLTLDHLSRLLTGLHKYLTKSIAEA
jgi:four helix bundle protein